MNNRRRHVVLRPLIPNEPHTGNVSVGSRQLAPYERPELFLVW